MQRGLRYSLELIEDIVFLPEGVHRQRLTFPRPEINIFGPGDGIPSSLIPPPPPIRSGGGAWRILPFKPNLNS